MKILLVYVSNLYEKPFLYLDYQMTPGDIYIPKVGILSLIAGLREKYPDLEYKALDVLNPPGRTMPSEQLENGILNTMSEEEFRREISEFDPDLVGFSCLSSNSVYLPKLVKIVKDLKKDSLCILGGPYATSSPQKAVLTEGIDFIFIGEGEISLRNFVGTLLNGGDVENIKGLGFRRNKDIVMTQPQPYVEDLDKLPFPAWDLCNIESYSKVHRILGSGVQHSENTNYANIVSSRGCPYNCIYCHKIFGSKFRSRSAQNIVDEMIYLHDEFNVEEFTFSDDSFNLDKKRVKEFCGILIKANRNIKFGFFTNGLRGDILNKELIDLLWEAGMRTASIAIESASPRIQKLMKKNLNLDKAKQNINYISKKKIYLSTYNMIGFPTETAEEIRQTLKFNIGLNHHAQFVFAVIPHEGTPLYDMIKKDGYDLKEYEVGNLWQQNKLDGSFSAVSSIFIRVMLVKFFVEFYFSEKRLKINLDIMEYYKDNKTFIDSLKRLYTIHWRMFSRGVSPKRRKEIGGLVKRIIQY